MGEARAGELRIRSEIAGDGDRLTAIRVPALVVYGGGDVLVLADNAHLLAEQIPGTGMSISPGTGHGCPTQDAVAVRRTIAELLRAY